MPIIINQVREIYSKKFEKYLISRGLLKRYRKAKNKILQGCYQGTDFKQRKGNGGEFSFRINKQYRAFCILEGETLAVYEINDHSNF